jgi:hypothetical protein
VPGNIRYLATNSPKAIVNNRLRAMDVTKKDKEKARHFLINRDTTKSRHGKNA